MPATPRDHSDTDPGFGQDPNAPESPGHLPGDVEAGAPGHDLPDHAAPETPGHLPGDVEAGAPGHDLPPAVQPPEGGVAVPEHPIELPGSAEHPIELPDGSEQIPEGYRKPNILVIFGDDIGHDNISWYNRGLLGHRTPNIDRIANEGVGFTDAYAEQSCTAGRASFLLGQSGIRTGLTRIGFPGDLFGISLDDPTLALLLKGQGYTTAQFGKNHLGDRDWHLPTVHGFDRFFGNLYHLQAEEEPEHPDFPENPLYPRPRGVLDCRNTGVLQQEITDTGPLTKERMPTIDDEFADAAEAWIREQHAAGKPWFCWTNSSRMHIWTRLKEESEGKTGLGIYPDGMVEHDAWVGRQLDLLDELGITEDTIVLYTTDNGAEVFSWPDGGCTPFRNEKNSMYDGAYRVPMMMRWPGHIPAGAECNGIISHLDLLPTLMAAAGLPNIKQALLAGFLIGDQNRPWKACLDGYNMLPALTTEGEKWPRSEFFYINDQGEVWRCASTSTRSHSGSTRSRGSRCGARSRCN